jgi:hypothetical protein
MPKLITRKAHIRKSYFRSDGTLVTAAKIPKTIVKLKKQTIFPGIDKPVFHGYSVKDPAAKRRVSLMNAKRDSNAVSVIKKLNALAVLTKNTQPKNSKIYKSDMHWMQSHR